MSKEILSIDQRLQVARMATDIVRAQMHSENAIYHFTDDSPGLQSEHALFLFAYDMILEKVTAEPGND